MSFVVALALGLAVAAAACDVLPSPSGVDQSRAVELAQRHAGAVDRLVEARLVRAADDPEVAPIGLPPDRIVWRVSFSSSEVRPCGPAPGGNVCRIDSKVVIIDALTGDVITSSELGSTLP